MAATESNESYLRQATDFYRTCIEITPLRKYSRLFEMNGSPEGEHLREGLAEGRADFESDLKRWGLESETPAELFERLLFAPSLQATFHYRVSHALFLRRAPLVPDVIASLSRLLTGTEIYYSAEIGPGLKLIHGGGSIIGSGCKIGTHFTVYQNVTIGDRLGRETGQGSRPVIGDYVIASAGAQILGPVEVGSRSIVGANSLVIHSIPPDSMAAGLPAKVVTTVTDEDFRLYWAAIKG